MNNVGFWPRIALFSMLLVLAGSAFAAPGIPHQFYGSVLINGSPANGAIVTATVDGVEYESEPSTNGKFGYSPDTFFVEDPDDGIRNEGKTITFYVNGISTGVTRTFVNGALTDLGNALSVTQTGGPVCGNGSCESGETTATCASDCPAAPSDDGGSSSTPPSSGGGGGGGGGGGSGDPKKSNLLKVSPASVEVGEEVIFSALCKWNFGCFIETEGEQAFEMVKSSGFQGFGYTYDTIGEKTVRLYQSGTKPTLVAEKTVTVKEKAAVQPEQQDEVAPLEEDTAEQVTAGSGETPEGAELGTGQAEEQTGDAAPTGFASLGAIDLGSLLGGNNWIFLLLIVLIIIGAIYFATRKKEKGK